MKTETVEFASENARIHGVLYVPNHTPAPTLVICHGFDRRGFKGYRIFAGLAEAACKRGFLVLVFDFRGCGDSTGEFGYGWSEQRDLEAAVDFLMTRQEANPNSVYVVGHSLGGAVALYVAEKDRRIRGVVLWATPHDHAYNVKKFITQTRGKLVFLLFLLISYVDVIVPVHRLFSLRVYGITLRPRDVRQKLMKLKECDVLSRLEDVPVLIVNGSGDEIVELKEARLNFEAANEPKELLVIEDDNHAFQGKEKETIDGTLSWLLGQVNIS